MKDLIVEINSLLLNTSIYTKNSITVGAVYKDSV